MKRKIFLGLALTTLIGINHPLYASDAIETNGDTQNEEIVLLQNRLSALEQELQTLKSQQESTASVKPEKKASSLDSVKLYGDARIRAIDSGDGYKFQQRVRLNFEKQLDDHANFRIRSLFMNENEVGTTGDKDSHSTIDNAYIEYKKLNNDPSTSVKIGRFGQTFGSTGYWASEGNLGMYDGIEFTTGKKVKASIGFGDWGGATSNNSKTDPTGTTANKVEENYYLKLAFNSSKATSWQTWYLKETSADSSPVDYNVLGLGFKSKLSDDFSMAFDYSRNSAIEGNPTGKFLTLSYKKADYSKPHSFGANLYYADVDKGNTPSSSVRSINIPASDVKGPGLSLHYTLAKNVMTEFFTGFNMEKKSTGQEQDNYYRFQISSKI